MKPCVLACTSTALVVVAALSAPGRATNSPGAEAPPPAPASRRAPAEAPPAIEPSTSALGAATSCEAERKLASLDARLPVPLLPHMAHHQKQIMRDHLLAVQEIVAAAANDDFGAIENAASRIGYSEEMGQMCNHMGAGAPGFTEQALQFHRTADGIVVAARERDRTAVLQALGRTLATCTACHATFRQRVVEPAAWSASPAKAAPQTAPTP